MRVLIFTLVTFSCGRELIVTTGTEGGRCYGNGTCNEGLFCSGSGLCVEREPGAIGCTGAACFPGSTDGMMLIDDFPGGSFYIDIYEASIVVGGDYGSRDQDQDDDGKIADPDVVAAHAASHGLVWDDDGGEEAVELSTIAAQSVPFEVPEDLITFFQAAAACTNAGKRLCTDEEWLWACRGAEARRYAYGDSYDGGDEPGVDCWTDYMVSGVPQPSGTASGCVTPEGVFDLSGNVWEFTEYIDTNHVQAFGGSAVDSGSASECGATVGHWSSDPRPSDWNDFLGFRCCRPL